MIIVNTKIERLSHKNMPVSQKNGYFDNSIFRRTYATSVGFKMKPLRKSIFPVLRQNLTQILL